MSAKTYLDAEELTHFPTIAELTEKAGKQNVSVWGFCKNEKGEVVLTTQSKDWSVVVSLGEIYAEAKIMLGEGYEPENVRVVYFVEVFPNQKGYIEYFVVDVEEFGRLSYSPKFQEKRGS